MMTAYKFIKSLFFYICIMLLITITSFAQDAPVPLKHLVNRFIERQITLGNLSQSAASVRPFTYSKVREMFKQLAVVSDKLSNKDLQLLLRFESEFSTREFDRKISFPLQKSTIRSIRKTASGKYQMHGSEPHFLSYQDPDIYAWMDVGETLRLEAIEESVFRRFTEQVSVFGSIFDRLSFYVNFTMNRLVGDSSLVYQIEDFKNEDHPYFDTVNWTLWYQSEATFNISTKYGNIQLSKTPVVWGFSPEHSPILSGNTQTFPYTGYSFKYKNIGFHFIHGSLLPNESISLHINEENPQKYLAAHRIELELGKNLIMSFNEMVIYGNRPFEIEYLIPVNFYWAAEHNQGDRDNILMALDCSWRIKPGLRWYNTLFWDELAWEQLLSKWWGNKFILQTGIHWVSKTNPYLADLRVEATVSRPWIYTHNNMVNSYTSAEIGLGLPQGPNSQSLLIKAGFWPSYRWHFNISSMLIRQGTGFGSSALDNYDLRDPELDEDTPYLLGEIRNSSEFRFETNYSINRIVDVFGLISYKNPNSEYSGHLGITIDW
ncbi:MAG: hypothetical protein V3R52_07825 [Candidatus Neomarinimicrobiota bacterium]